MRLKEGIFQSPLSNFPIDEELQRTIPPMELPTQVLKCAQQAFLEVWGNQGVQIQRFLVPLPPEGGQLVPSGWPESQHQSLEWLVEFQSAARLHIPQPGCGKKQTTQRSCLPESPWHSIAPPTLAGALEHPWSTCLLAFTQGDCFDNQFKRAGRFGLYIHRRPLFQPTKVSLDLTELHGAVPV